MLPMNTPMKKRSVLLVAVIAAMQWAPVVAMLVILGVLFGWRIPVAVTVACALTALRWATEPNDPGRLRTTVEFIAFALIGMLLGAFAIGALGGIVGFTIGVVARLAEIPTTGAFRSRKPGDSKGSQSG
jgi:hypothetical protein